MRVRPRAAALTAALVLGGCSESPSEPRSGVPEITGLPRTLSVFELAVVDASNRFGFDLLGRVHAEAPDSNVFLSPLSASMALGMTMDGAEGSTFDGMRQALRFGSLPREEINSSYRSLIDLLRGLDPAVRFAIANSIWHRSTFQPEPSFLDRARQYFDAEVAGLDFSDPAAAGVINAWVDRSTNGRIREIVEPPIDPLTVMFLINAIYFKGIWTFEFDESRTRQAPFARRDGTTLQVRLMEQTGGFPYASTSRYQAVDLPYGGKAFAMTVVLPAEGVDVADLVADLDAEGWGDLVARLSEANGTVHLPRFTLEWERVLNEDLIAMGMEEAFDPGRADFSRMHRAARDLGVHIKRVKQKTFVQVDEEGTEAAAVTSVEVGIVCAGCGGGRFDFRADRPFLYVLRERFSGTVLFVGVMVEPAEA